MRLGLDEASYASQIAEYLPLVDLVWIEELEKLEIVSSLAAARVRSFLLREKPDLGLWDFTLGQDPYAARFAYMASELGQDAEIVNVIRARRDAVTTAWVMSLRQATWTFCHDVWTHVSTLLSVAEEHLDTPWPEFTYHQAAQIGSYGHFLLGHIETLRRSLIRFEIGLSALDYCPLGTGSTVGTRFTINREAIAAALEFRHTIWHSRDAVWQADVVAGLAGDLVSLSIGIERMSNDLLFYASHGIKTLSLAVPDSRSSYILPHKKNPYSLVITRLRARDCVTKFQGIALTQLGPSGFPDSRIHAYRTLVPAVQELGSAADALVFSVTQSRVNRSQVEQICNNQEFTSYDSVEGAVAEGHGYVHELFRARQEQMLSQVDHDLIDPEQGELNRNQAGWPLGVPEGQQMQDGYQQFRNVIRERQSKGSTNPEGLRSRIVDLKDEARFHTKAAVALADNYSAVTIRRNLSRKD